MRAEAAGRLPLVKNTLKIMFIQAGAPISEYFKRDPQTAPYTTIIQVPPFFSYTDKWWVWNILNRPMSRLESEELCID